MQVTEKDSSNFFPNDYLPTIHDKDVNHVLESELEHISSLLLEYVNGASFASNKDFSVYSGTAGIAYMFFRLTESVKLRNKFESIVDRWEAAAKKSIDVAIATIENEKENVASGGCCLVGSSSRIKKEVSTFLKGHAGVFAVAAAIYFKIDKKKSEHYSRHVLDYSPNIVENDRLPCGVINGISGYLSTLLFMSKHAHVDLKSDLFKDLTHKLVLHVLLRGRLLAKVNISPFPLMWQWRGDQFTGTGYGICGILCVMLNFHEDVRNAGFDKCIRNTIEGLYSARLKSGNLPKTLNGSKTDVLVQWCHGSPGFISLLNLSSALYPQNREIYQRYVEDVSDVVMKRGLVRNGFGINDGISGNALALICAHKVSKLEHHYSQAIRFAVFTSIPNCDDASSIKDSLLWKPKDPYSLMEGASGLACLFAAILGNDENAELYCNGGCPWLM